MSSQEQNGQQTSWWKQLFCSIGRYLFQSRCKIRFNFYILLIVVIFIQVHYKSEKTSLNFSSVDIKQAFLQKYADHKIPETSQSTPKISAVSVPIDLNNASREELDTLPGIGTKLADSIIQYRQEIGGFTKSEELLEIRGIGPKNFAKLKDKVVIGSVMARQSSPETELQSRSFVRPEINGIKTSETEDN